MKILGIDPGLGITGYGLVEDSGTAVKLIEAGVIRTYSESGITARLLKIYDGLSEIIEEYRPDALVIEKVYSHYKHPMTAILMGHARGVVALAANSLKLEVVNYPAKTVKRAVTGNGNASKEQVQRSVERFLNLKSCKGPVDITDALALCLTHIFHNKK